MRERSFISIDTNWFDRLFIGVISFFALQLLWIHFLENILSIKITIGIGVAWIIFVIWKG